MYEPLLLDLYTTSQVVGHWEDMISDNDSAIVRFVWKGYLGFVVFAVFVCCPLLSSLPSVFAQFTSGLTWCLSDSLPCLPIYNINFIAMAEANGFDNVSVFRGESK